MLPALTRFLLIIAIVFGMLFYGVGGWYFADEFRNDALDVEPYQSTQDVRVTAASAATVALDTVDDPSVAADGWFGMSWDGGAGLTGPILDSVGTSVVREFVPLYGDMVRAGDRVDFDPWVWPIDPEQGLGLAFNDVTFDTPLGQMEAWEIPADPGSWVIMVHGKGADKREGLRLAAIVNGLGMTSLLIDYRNDEGAPEDPSGMYQYGVTEWQDLEGAVEYALDHGAEHIVLAGLSSGAAASMALLYESSLATEIDQVIFDSPNIDMEQTVRHGASQRRLPVVGLAIPDSLVTAAMWIAERRFGVDFDAWDYLSRADELRAPMLVLHGDRDATVPHRVSVDLATARPDLVTYHEFIDADHVGSWNVDRDRYAAAVVGFLTGE